MQGFHYSSESMNLPVQRALKYIHHSDLSFKDINSQKNYPVLNTGKIEPV